jgi:hypothetical protein
MAITHDHEDDFVSRAEGECRNSYTCYLLPKIYKNVIQNFFISGPQCSKTPVVPPQCPALRSHN